jgi:hypothetical protein
MSFLISSQKRVGAGHSKSFADAKGAARMPRCSRNARSGVTSSCLLGLFLFSEFAILLAGEGIPAPKISKTAADRCSVKLKMLEDFSSKRKAGEHQTTHISEEEINSYLDLDLSSEYHPSLKSLEVTLEEGKLQVLAAIDFDRLGKTSTRFWAKMASLMFSGSHTINACGQLVSDNGYAYFRLEEARFDDNALPKALVEEIITAVGRRQKPPFDPLQPSKLPYKIDKVDVHSGYIIVYQ